MILKPNAEYRTSMREGMAGWDVASIQIALNDRAAGAKLDVDGIYGPLTKRAVKEAQKRLGTEQDGICGPVTMARICIEASRIAETGLCPHDLLKGLVLGESSGIIPETVVHEDSEDVGPWQRNLPLTPTQTEAIHAFRVVACAKDAGSRLAKAQAVYAGEPWVREHDNDLEEAWRLAVLSYNWPAAADAIAEGRGDTWRYQDSDGHLIGLGDPAKWIEAIGRPDLKTGWQWASFYVESKVLYVKSWLVV